MIKRMNFFKGIRNWTRTIFVIQKWWCLSEWHHNSSKPFKNLNTGHSNDDIVPGIPRELLVNTFIHKKEEDSTEK
jgi:hypothetical protein